MFRTGFAKKSAQPAPAPKRSYAQSGEDLIARFIFSALGKTKIKYLDIGAYNAFDLSNTYHFYEAGDAGVCVEPNPKLAAAFAAARPRDTIVEAAVSGGQSGEMEFFIMSSPTLSTASRAEAERLVQEDGYVIEQTIRTPVRPIANLVRDCFPNRDLDFVSLDIEGNDLDVLEHFDFSFVRPLVFCVETLSYRKFGTEEKSQAIAQALQVSGYMLYADTYINSLFVDEAAWRGRPR